MTGIRHMREVVSRISFEGFTFEVDFDATMYWLRVGHSALCNVSGDPLDWKGRKWLLSVHMTDGEIVQTAFLAVLTALEHETREQFKYRDVAVFDPHYDIEKLVALRRDPASIKERT